MESKLTVLQRLELSTFVKELFKQDDYVDFVMTANGIYGGIFRNSNEIWFGSSIINDGKLVVSFKMVPDDSSNTGSNVFFPHEHSFDGKSFTTISGIEWKWDIDGNADKRDIIKAAIEAASSSAFTHNFIRIVRGMIRDRARIFAGDMQLSEDRDNDGSITFREQPGGYIDSINVFVNDNHLVEARAHVVRDGDPVQLLSDVMSDDVYEFVDTISYIR